MTKSPKMFWCNIGMVPWAICTKLLNSGAATCSWHKNRNYESTNPFFFKNLKVANCLLVKILCLYHVLQWHFCVYFDYNRKFYLEKKYNKKIVKESSRNHLTNLSLVFQTFLKLQVHETTIHKLLIIFIFSEANSFWNICLGMWFLI